MVLEGKVLLEQPGKDAQTLLSNEFAFFPSDAKYKLSTAHEAGLLVYERLLDSATATALGTQEVLTGDVEAQPLLDTGML